MARQINVSILCDPCLSNEIASEGAEEYVLTIQGVAGGKPRVVALCSTHRKEFYDPISEVLSLYGQPPIKAGAYKGPRVEHLEESSGPVVCPACDRSYKNRGSLRSHCSETHHRTLAQLEGKPTPFPCETCEMAFERNQQLALHTKRAHVDAA